MSCGELTNPKIASPPSVNVRHKLPRNSNSPFVPITSKLLFKRLVLRGHTPEQPCGDHAHQREVRRYREQAFWRSSNPTLANP